MKYQFNIVAAILVVFVLALSAGCNDDDSNTGSSAVQRFEGIKSGIADSLVAQEFAEMIQPDLELANDSVAAEKDRKVKEDLIDRIERSGFQGWTKDEFLAYYGELLEECSANCDTTKLLTFKRSLMDDPILSKMKRTYPDFSGAKRALDVRREEVLGACRSAN